MRAPQEKYETVIQKNTFYFQNPHFEESNEAHIHAIKSILLYIKHEIKAKGINKNIFQNIIEKKENGLKAILALNGFSYENLRRIITIVRIKEDAELSDLFLKNKWCQSSGTDISEWSYEKINKLARENKFFRAGIVNFFFEGSSVPFLCKNLPLFELKKIDISKLSFDIDDLIDSLIRYRQKGSYSGNMLNNPEVLIKDLLSEQKISFESGDTSVFKNKQPDKKRQMDFIIPNKQDPKIFVECSFLATTSSGQGDKAKAEIQMRAAIKENYPKAQFIGFVDGIGWYVRKKDLRRMTTAFDDVYTFHAEEMERFICFLKKIMNT